MSDTEFSGAALPPSATAERWRLSRRASLWVVAFSFFVVTAFSTAPSSLYGLYEEREILTSFEVTVVYSVYAAGLIASLLLAGHVSDWYGRRPVLVLGMAVAIAAALVLIVWISLPGLLVARVLTGVAVGMVVATATAFIGDLDGGGVPTRQATVVATVANIGGLGAGPLLAGLLTLPAADALTLPFAVFLGALALAVVGVLLAREGRPPVLPRPSYRPQRFAAPPQARARFLAACVGVLLCFAVFGLVAGLAGRFLAETGHPSPASAGVAVLLTFGSGIAVQIATLDWPAQRLIAAGLGPTLAGLAVLVASAWTTAPSAELFVVGGVIAGAGGGAIFRGSLTLVVGASAAGERAGALATFFTAGYVGVSLPVLGVGILLEHLSSRVTLLVFGVTVTAGFLAAARVLLVQTSASKAASAVADDDVALRTQRTQVTG